MDGKLGSACVYVKVSMDGAPYLRKVDLKIYKSYNDLSSALEKMFSCFTIGNALMTVVCILFLFGLMILTLEGISNDFFFF